MQLRTLSVGLGIILVSVISVVEHWVGLWDHLPVLDAVESQTHGIYQGTSLTLFGFLGMKMLAFSFFGRLAGGG